VLPLVQKIGAHSSPDLGPALRQVADQLGWTNVCRHWTLACFGRAMCVGFAVELSEFFTMDNLP